MVREAPDRALGFTIAELLILLTILLIIAAIAFPKLLRSQIAADEAAAVYSLNAINKAETAYQAAYPTVGFADSLEALGAGPGGTCANTGATHACLLDPRIAAAASVAHPNNGYWFRLSPTTRDANGIVSGYVVGGVAAEFNKTGVRDFCSLEDRIIRFRVSKAQSEPTQTAAVCLGMPVLE